MTELPHRPARRAYRSDARARQAARTREVITRAARQLFETHGFAGTTIAAIATESGVSQQSVYGVFGSKAGLLRAILEQMEESADAAAWRERITAEKDAGGMLTAFAQWTRAFFEASSPTFASTAITVPELADLAAQGEQHRRRALTALVKRLSDMGALRDGLTEQSAVDRAWLLTGINLYIDATAKCGWSPEAYGEWLAETLVQQILRRPAHGND